jgi:tRNA uridine 5-carboxymethylaminomethyl modification enzyme
MAMAFRARSAALMRQGRLRSFMGRSRGLATVTDNTQSVFSPGYRIGA